MPTPTVLRIVPVQGARWVIMRDDGVAVLADRDFPDQQVAVAALQELARSQHMEMVVRYRPDGKVDHVVIGKGLTADRPPVKLTVTLPAALDDDLTEMAEAMQTPREEVVRRAIALLKVAFDVNEQGNRLAILTPDDEIVRDVVSIPTTNQAPLPVAR